MASLTSPTATTNQPFNLFSNNHPIRCPTTPTGPLRLAELVTASTSTTVVRRSSKEIGVKSAIIYTKLRTSINPRSRQNKKRGRTNCHLKGRLPSLERIESTATNILRTVIESTSTWYLISGRANKILAVIDKERNNRSFFYRCISFSDPTTCSTSAINCWICSGFFFFFSLFLK